MGGIVIRIALNRLNERLIRSKSGGYEVASANYAPWARKAMRAVRRARGGAANPSPSTGYEVASANYDALISA